MDHYIPSVKYPVTTNVYISVGELLLEGVVINTRIALGTERMEYLVKYSTAFKDGMTHAKWHFATDLSNMLPTPVGIFDIEINTEILNIPKFKQIKNDTREQINSIRDLKAYGLVIVSKNGCADIEKAINDNKKIFICEHVMCVIDENNISLAQLSRIYNF